jgi:uncharacterized membrane protein
VILVIVLIVIAGCAIFAYVPLVLTVRHRDERYTQRLRPVDEILKDAFAAGLITERRLEEALDEVHAAMPTIDMPYPKVRELERRRL